MGPVDQLGGGIMDRLQAHFHPEIGSLIQLGQVFDDVVRQAIGRVASINRQRPVRRMTS